MTGIQETVRLGLKAMMEYVEEGRYGKDDDFDEESFINDLDDYVTNVTQ